VKTRPLERTKVPGVFKRGSRYVVVYRDPQGRQRKRSARTLAEARDLKATLRADVSRGEYRALSRVTFADYAPEWISNYQGRTSRGFRDTTRAEYARDLGLDPVTRQPLDPPRGAVAFFGRMRLTEIEPRDIKRYASELAHRGLAPSSVRLELAPLRALLSTAVEEGLIRSNPAAGLRITQRVAQDHDEGERVKALTEAELVALLGAARCPRCQKAPRVGCAECRGWRLFFEFLAHTGVRIGEAVPLRFGDVDFGRRRVKVRRRFYRGTFAPPKSSYGRRDIPLSAGMARRLWELRKTTASADDAYVFASSTGGLLDSSNVFSRVLKPSAKAAGVPWAGFHTFRHTCATLLFRRGFNAKQVQVWLGHHSPAFTLATYVHLLPDDLPDPVFLDEVTAGNDDAGDRRDGGDERRREQNADHLAVQRDLDEHRVLDREGRAEHKPADLGVAVVP
jgi:integrase